MRNFRGQQFAETSTDHRRYQQFTRSLFSGSESSDQANPAADLTFAKKSERVADGMHFVLNSKCCRIQIAQEPIAYRSLLLDNEFDLSDIDLRLRNRAQQPQVVHAICWYIFGVKHFGPAEEVSLEINESGGLGGNELFARFDFL